MESKDTLCPAPLIFAAAAGLTAYMAGGLTAGAAAFLLCTLAGFFSERFGRVYGFVPAAVGVLAAAVVRSRFIAECAFCADEAAYLHALKTNAVYRPLTGAAESAPLILLLLCGIACAIYAAAGEKTALVCIAAFAAAGEVFLGGSTAVLCVIVAMAAATCCFGARELRSLPVIALTVLLAFPAVLIKLPSAVPKGEVKASGGLPLYLAEKYEQPQLTKQQYARAGAIFTALWEDGFDPRLQTAYLLEATNADLPTEEVTSPLTPANVCAGEVSNDTLDGFDGSRYTVCRELDSNIFELLTKLHEGDYLDREGLYREYVYSAYGSLTAAEAQKMKDICPIDGSLPLDKKLDAVRKGVNAHLNDENERTQLTVGLARSCGIAAREVGGIYFSAMPASGSAELSEGESRSWAEVYIDGAGWVVLETRPEYENAAPLLPKGIASEGGKSVTEAADRYIYASAPPRTAAEIRSEPTHERPSALLLTVPAGMLVILFIAGRTRAVLRRSARNSRDISIAIGAAHVQGRQLLEAVLGEKGLPPENLATHLDGLLSERFNASERAYEKLRFSRTGADENDLKAAKRFYDEAVRASKKQGFIKSLCRRSKGLY